MPISVWISGTRGRRVTAGRDIVLLLFVTLLASFPITQSFMRVNFYDMLWLLNVGNCEFYFIDIRWSESFVLVLIFTIGHIVTYTGLHIPLIMELQSRRPL